MNSVVDLAWWREEEAKRDPNGGFLFLQAEFCVKTYAALLARAEKAEAALEKLQTHFDNLRKGRPYKEDGYNENDS